MNPCGVAAGWPPKAHTIHAFQMNLVGVKLLTIHQSGKTHWLQTNCTPLMELLVFFKIGGLVALGPMMNGSLSGVAEKQTLNIR